MGIRTRLREALGIAVPILSAPMGFVAGGKLAAAVTAAGGLGIIGGGYGDADWLDREFAAAGNSRVGCGFITWSLARACHQLSQTTLATSWTPARKFRAVFSYRVAMARNCLILAKKFSIRWRAA